MRGWGRDSAQKVTVPGDHRPKVISQRQEVGDKDVLIIYSMHLASEVSVKAIYRVRETKPVKT